MATDDMEYERFIEIVQQAAGGSRQEAERAAQVTLGTLSERIDRGEARDLAVELPPEIAGWLTPGPEAQGFGVDEFLQRIADRERVDLPAAERHARAVFAALGQAVSPKQISDIASQLPPGFAYLLPRGPDVHVMPADDVVLKVAERAHVEPEQAWKATEAVLETLAERIAAGETEDLVARLAPALHPALERGMDREDGDAKRMSLAEFLAHVAEREAVDPDAAYQHAQAVFATLREAVSDDEFFDVTVQLPDEYSRVVRPPARS